MARTSKKGKRGQASVNKYFYVGIYARLSVEADVRKNESIDTQIMLVKEYMKKHPEMKLFDCYIDLGRTGTDFKRKGFERMMEDVRKKRIDCIIVKDLSRFGRNYIEAGNYIQKIFPFMGVRFIAVTDGIDTFRMETVADEMTLNLKNLLNEMYANDIAAKVKSSIQLRQGQGSYTGGVPPYGYIVKWEDGKRKLFIHKEAAGVVRDIYKTYLSGKRFKQIVEVLYARGIHRPAVYRRTGHVFCQEGELLEQWGIATVKLVLTNPVYMGQSDYVQEKVISEDSFFQAAAMIEEMAKKYNNQRVFSGEVPVGEDIYDGLLFCRDCGKKMRRTANVKKLCSGSIVRNYGYYCPASRRIDVLRCPPKSIGMNALNELVKDALRQKTLSEGWCLDRLVKKQKEQSEALKKQFRREILRCERILENRRRQDSELYIRYYTEEISLKEYQECREENEKMFRETLVRKESIIKQFQSVEQNTAAEAELKGLTRCNSEIVLTKELLRMLIKRIEVYQKNQIFIFFADI